MIMQTLTVNFKRTQLSYSYRGESAASTRAAIARHLAQKQVAIITKHHGCTPISRYTGCGSCTNDVKVHPDYFAEAKLTKMRETLNLIFDALLTNRCERKNHTNCFRWRGDRRLNRFLLLLPYLRGRAIYSDSNTHYLPRSILCRVAKPASIIPWAKTMIGAFYQPKLVWRISPPSAPYLIASYLRA